MKHATLVIFVAALSLFANTASYANPTGTLLPANDDPAPSISDELSEKTKAAVAKLVNMLGKVVENLPQYDMPEVLDNGDIIIRRKHPEEVEEEARGKKI